MPFPPVKNSVEIPLETFGGRVTEMAAVDCPEGVSPDEQDNTYIPGAVLTRPCLNKQLTNAPANTTVTYQKSFVTDLGAIKNLYLFSNGQIFWEDPINAPGALNLLFTGPSGSYAKSATMFGREYIAISDALHGATVPLQWDGLNLDRVTQEGPGAAPTVASIAYPAVDITTVTSVPAVISTITYEATSGPFYIGMIVTLSLPCPYVAGQQIVISGAAVGAADGTWTVGGVSGNQFGVGAYFSTTNPTGAGGLTDTPGAGDTLVRASNSVTGYTAAAHNLQIGYQVQIAGVAATQIGAGIASVVINNEDSPGIATITTNSAHGLAPEEDVFLDGIGPDTSVGGGLASYLSDSVGNVTVTTNSAHGLSVGSVVQVGLGATPGGGSPFVVTSVPSATTFTFFLGYDPSSGTSGFVYYVFPLADSGTPNTSSYTVLSAPTSTTFTVAFTYTDGTWTGGTVGFAWDGTFYVTAVPSTTSFIYQQYGPNASAAVVSGSGGTAIPYGQAAPGLHLMRLNFLTRQGALLRSGPFVQFVANGGQYLAISNIAIGPENIVARILEFTGADGDYYFYLPVPAQVNGQVVSTATQINDNTTTSIVLDFSDNSLFGGLATSIQGNDLRTQIVLDGALGFGQYATRLMTYGQRNRVQNLLGMGFDSGAQPSAPTIPTGWTPGTDGFGVLAANPSLPPSSAWFITVNSGGAHSGILSQSAYLDAYGIPILTGTKPYSLRLWLKPSAVDAGTNFYAVISSASTGFTSTATINGTAMSVAGSFVQANFSAVMPAAIPTDMLLTIYATSSTTNRILLVDEMSLIYVETPYLDGIIYGSYGNNPEGIAGVTGKTGPVTDTRKVMDFAVLRETFYMLTQEPSGRLHETTDNGTTEPSGWEVNEVGANCGALSAFSMTKSQADDTAASGGEEWMAWASLSGARIFGGSYPDKISQEIQPDWEQINLAAAKTVWCVNDPVARQLYFGVPLGAATAPSNILFMSYRELDSAQSIASSAPFRVSFSGKLIATDNTRKWSLWNVQANCGSLMYRTAGNLTMVLGGGNSATPGVGGYGNVYTLNPLKYTDDDYGQVSSYYYTYAFVNRGAEQALQVGSHQKGFLGLLATMTWPAGTALVQVAPNNPSNIWPLSCERTVSQPNIDLQWGGGDMLIARGSRFFIKFSSQPLAGQTDNAYMISMVTVMLAATRLRTRGAAQ